MICLWPYSYGFRTRAKTLWDKLSFAVIFPLPVWLLCGGSFLVFAGRFTALYCLYELGYLYNDYLTVRREKQPNFRLEAREYYRIRRRLPSIVFSRMVWILGLLRIFGVTLEQAAALCMVAAAFLLHNTVRSRWNIATYPLLCGTKYAAAVLLAGGGATEIGACIAAFMLPRSLEHAAKAKYGIGFLSGLPAHRFRFWYYAALSFFSTVLFFGTPLHLLALWYFAYRAAVYAVIRKKESA